ncbi:uncharacterized protein Z519_03861 [Cladophialophora bantiana CBS 173.52]|uniref:ubiquitinyl hydrolase 1 n=1 Tax=Cladophialophora bantiana (strain ATCC 10958 / CBS 173.52 / CDC B-1940 / NIH 8579) TaxID=1442370 RepID=A0A0D2G9G7_CLAB1|nr:uncharacterized protein Z519_03861 [Cladophialophora bantiana CBS 173.52]KIW95277.1 hypothetical protein Z519_03861 [Cladophialophora bantiana CBS 173.52]
MAVKTQLICPSGPQIAVDGGNYQWESIEMILKVATSHRDSLERSYESSIQIVHRETGGFPFIYFLRNDVQNALIQRIATDICSGRTPLLNVESFLTCEKQAIKVFITEARPQETVITCISDIHKSSQADGYVIYLLRALLVYRILILTLSRRWNVQYCLHHPLRDPVAVPYLAKSIPSRLAEWGYVDVSLLFTCLSFYYQGLSPQQLKQSLEQDDLKGLSHTNSEVLTYLLQDPNREYSLAGWRDNSHGQAVYRRMTEPELLGKLCHERIRVLIDSGESLLEMTNVTLAKIWLDIDTEATAAVFFDGENKAMILTRSGRKIPLLASPFADDLSGCLVYLDESHTRATDISSHLWFGAH